VARRGRIADVERELRFKDERINESKDEIDGERESVHASLTTAPIGFLRAAFATRLGSIQR
jgi:hypothetical protein